MADAASINLHIIIQFMTKTQINRTGGRTQVYKAILPTRAVLSCKCIQCQTQVYFLYTATCLLEYRGPPSSGTQFEVKQTFELLSIKKVSQLLR